MKRFFVLILSAIIVLGMAACADKTVTNDFVVLEASETNLLVAEMDERGEAVEGAQYSLPNFFNPSVKIDAGSVITVEHSGVVLESYPMQFARIYRVHYKDAATGRTVTATPEQ
jgi:hypothetical protein